MDPVRGGRHPAADPDRPGRGQRRRLPQNLGRHGARGHAAGRGRRDRARLVASPPRSRRARCWPRSARSRSCSASIGSGLSAAARSPASSRSPAWVGSLFGVATGFTSQIAHAGGPPFQMWVMPRRLPRDVLVGTTAIFFAVLNWIKVPAYRRARPVHAATTLIAALALLPLAIAREPRRRLAGPPGPGRALLHDHLSADDRRRREAAVGWTGRIGADQRACLATFTVIPAKAGIWWRKKLGMAARI